MRESDFLALTDAIGTAYGAEAAAHCGAGRDPHRSILFRITTVAAAAVGILLLTGAVMILRTGQRNLRPAYPVGVGAAPEDVKIHAVLKGAPHEPGYLGTAYTGSGIYYLGCAQVNGASGICYEDLSTGAQHYLCAKPECLHDGTSFCNATTPDYTFEELAYGDGMLYALATKHSGGNSAVLLGIQPDGSGITELAVLGEDTELEECRLIAHRGALWIAAGMKHAVPVEDSLLKEQKEIAQRSYALYHFDPDIRKLTWITGSTAETAASNPGTISELRGADDYVCFTLSYSGNFSPLGVGVYQVDARTGVIERLAIESDSCEGGYSFTETQLIYAVSPYPKTAENAGKYELHVRSRADGTETTCLIPDNYLIAATDTHVYLRGGEYEVLEYDFSGNLTGIARYPAQEEPEEAVFYYVNVGEFGITADGELWMRRRITESRGDETHYWGGMSVTLSHQPLSEAILPPDSDADSPAPVTLPAYQIGAYSARAWYDRPVSGSTSQ